MNPVIVRNVAIGEGKPKICVPIVGQTEEEILSEAKNLLTLPVDLVEWRADWFEYVFEIEKVLKIVEKLRKILLDLPILFTFRTSREGGEKSISSTKYIDLNLAVAKSGFVDLIDVEMLSGDEIVTYIIEEAHKVKVKVVGSNHDFSKTPNKQELVKRLCRMQELDADIPKIAVMPSSRQDVLTLLSATLEMSEQYANRPIITMSMAGSGVISRLAGETFGSALTFGSASRASAPGQIEARELSHILDVIHKSLL